MTIKGKATSLDIAHLAGVSQPTVSRALRGSPMVNAETRERILRIARELNYKVDKNASSLRLRNAGTLALLFFEDPTNDDSLINPFFHSMLGSITRACALHGQDLLVSFQQLSTDWQADYEDSNKADGIILLGYGDYHESRDRLQRLVEQGTHFVRWGAALPGQPGVSIGSDNFQGGHDITTHLLQQGCRRIAFLGHASSHYPEFQERYRGHVAALQDHGLAAEPALQHDAGHHALPQQLQEQRRLGHREAPLGTAATEVADRAQSVNQRGVAGDGAGIEPVSVQLPRGVRGGGAPGLEDPVGRVEDEL